MNLEGRLIGNRYEILEKIGNGGMATVYKAQDRVLKRYVAVKVLRDEFTTDEEFIRRFNTEAQSAASLTHPNIVSIYDVGMENNIYYIVMELIQGKTLKQIIDEGGVLPWKWSLDIAIQIASALEVAHKNNIIHRDIKPHNIIITEDGVAKVTDFGIAKAVSNSTITAFGTTIGSVHYFSPEHARGGFTDAKSDLYSLGVVMYEMLTGRVPFDADTPVSIALKHMQEKPVEPIKLNPSIPYSVNKIIMKALEKDLNLRYQSATEMLKDLNMALKDPEGDFVKTSSNEMAYTQRIETIPDATKSDNNGNMSRQSDEKPENKKKKEGFFKTHPAVKWLIIVLLVILIPIIGFFGTQAILNAGRTKDVELPNFVNMTREEAERQAEESKLVLDISEEFNSEVDAGKVISQEPSFLEGYTVKEESTVKIVVSKGENIKIVPKVVGEEVEPARELLKAEELEMEVIEENSDEVEPGIIMRQEPEADEEVNAGSTVKVYVSAGIKQITMTNVVNKKEADAKKELEDIGFKVTVEYEEDTSKDDGIVLRQTVDEGATVNDGTSVMIVVNRIEERFTVGVNINVNQLTKGYRDSLASQDNPSGGNTGDGTIDGNAIGEGTTGGSSTGITTVTVQLGEETRPGVSVSETAYNMGGLTYTGKKGETLEVKLTITDPSNGNATAYSTSKTITFGTTETLVFE